MKKKVYFRADANAQIGYGHFIRTLALADMMKEYFDCVFYTTDPSSYQIEEMQKVCSYIPLSEETKFEDFISILDGSEIVVLDNYFYTTDYQKAIKSKGCKLVCIDDMHDKHYVADIVINHSNVSADVFSLEPYTRLCIGRSWILLRKPFLMQLNPSVRSKSIVICFGGADPFCLTDKIADYLFKIGVNYEIICILGDSARLRRDYKCKVKIMHNLTAQEMADLFASSSIGIMPVSTVYMEAVSRGLKVIAGYFVDNQRLDFDKIVLNKDFVPVYNFNDLTKERLDIALQKIEEFDLNVPDYTKVPNNYINLFSSL